VIRILAIGAAVLAALAGFLVWRLTAAHEALGKAELKAQLNANTVKVLQEQEARNQAIDQRLEQLAQAGATHTREVVRDIYQQPSSDACRRSAPMRALDGRLQWRPGDPDGRPPAAAAPAQPVHPAR
jgi:small-conductance mechanosensitive channel